MSGEEKLSWGAGCLVVLLLVGLMIFGVFNKFVFGNKQFIDLKQNFNTAYIIFPDGTSQKMRIQAWKDYNNSDSIQVIDIDGKPFYTHLNRVILTKE